LTSYEQVPEQYAPVSVQSLTDVPVNALPLFCPVVVTTTSIEHKVSNEAEYVQVDVKLSSEPENSQSMSKVSLTSPKLMVSPTHRSVVSWSVVVSGAQNGDPKNAPSPDVIVVVWPI